MAKKKVVTLENKKEKNEFEIALESFSIEDKDVDVTIGDKNLTLHIKQHVPIEDRSAIVLQAKDAYFSNGTYNPEVGDAIIEYVVFSLYTGVSFENDIDKFEMFAKAIGWEDLKPREADLLIWSVREVRDRMANSIGVTDEQKEFYNAAYVFANTLTETVVKLDGYLDALAKTMTDSKDFSLSEVLEVMRDYKAKDEGKIVEAILDYQKRKAIKEADKKPVKRTKSNKKDDNVIHL